MHFSVILALTLVLSASHVSSWSHPHASGLSHRRQLTGVETNKDDNEQPKIWAVLVAGSNGYYNYRHQADVCHAYQILKRHGIPDENIIVMMYDDIANSSMNPTKGIIINEPNGKDVYAGVLKDYTGDDVSPQNFLKVLKGDESGLKGVGSGRVLKSGPKDHVFVNFVDHGAPGLLAFPNDELHARELHETLKYMYQSNRYGKLVMYIEACESGSMFENLLNSSMNIFVTTAANPHEHSYACYYDSLRETYLGDVYSVMWMQDSEEENLWRESLQRQFVIVRKETNTSHVQEYGDLTIGKMKVAEFQGRTNLTKLHASHERKPMQPSPLADAVPSGEVPLAILKRQLSSTNSKDEMKTFERKIRHIEKKRQFLLDTLRDIVDILTNGDPKQTDEILTQRKGLKNLVCYEQLVKAFKQRCFNLSNNEYALRQLFVLVNICENSIEVGQALKAMDSVCTHPRKYTGIV